jgi:hypothetical protein
VINEYFWFFLFIYGEDDVGVVENEDNVVENWQETRDFKTIKDDSKYNQRNSCVKTLNVVYILPF